MLSEQGYSTNAYHHTTVYGTLANNNNTELRAVARPGQRAMGSLIAAGEPRFLVIPPKQLFAILEKEIRCCLELSLNAKSLTKSLHS